MFFGEKILKKTKFSKEQNSEKNKIEKTEKSKKLIFFVPFVWTLKIFYETTL